MASNILVKYDTDGNVIWDRYVENGQGAVGGRGCVGLSVDSSGNLYLLCLDVDISHSTLLLKFDQNGNSLWQVSWQSASTGGATLAMAANGLGSIYVTGYTFDPLFTKASAFMLRFDEGGNLIWQYAYGGANPFGEQGWAVAAETRQSLC